LTIYFHNAVWNELSDPKYSLVARFSPHTPCMHTDTVQATGNLKYVPRKPQRNRIDRNQSVSLPLPSAKHPQTSDDKKLVET